jgi:hypothetical protein
MIGDDGPDPPRALTALSVVRSLWSARSGAARARAGGGPASRRRRSRGLRRPRRASSLGAYALEELRGAKIPARLFDGELAPGNGIVPELFCGVAVVPFPRNASAARQRQLPSLDANRTAKRLPATALQGRNQHADIPRAVITADIPVMQ